PASSSSSFYSCAAHRHLHSFPTRRSSDLVPSHRPPVTASPSATAASSSVTAGYAAEEVMTLLASPDPSATFMETNAVTIRTPDTDRKSTRLNSSHSQISYAVFCLKKKKRQ